MSNVTDIRNARDAISAGVMVQTALGAMARNDRRDDIMALVHIVLTANAVQSELHTQMQLEGHDELTVTQQAAWDAADEARDRAKAALPGALGLAVADIDLLRGVL
jgi:hypothetical protein